MGGRKDFSMKYQSFVVGQMEFRMAVEKVLVVSMKEKKHLYAERMLVNDQGPVPNSL